jgi:uncharacterized protein
MKICRIFIITAVSLLFGWHTTASSESMNNRSSSSKNTLSIQELQNQAKLCDAEAQFYLGVAYNEGDRVTKDYAQALHWFLLAAQQGNRVATFNVGNLYLHGNGVKQDHAEAARWYRKAANQGYGPAMSNLGYLYLAGSGIEQDFGKAFDLFTVASAQGVPDASSNLAGMFYRGYGVTKNNVMAHVWWQLALEQGDRQAGQWLKMVEKEMTSEEIQKAAQSAEELKQLVEQSRQ